MKKRCIIALGLLMFLINGFSQVETVERIEFELKEGYSNHDHAKFKENGVLFYAKSTSKKGKTRQWKIESYSTDLELKDTEFITIPKDQYLDETYTTDTDLYMFFKNKKGFYTFFKINARSLKIQRIQGQLPKKTRVYEIHVVDEVVFFDAKLKKSSMLFVLDLSTERQKLVPIKIAGYEPKELSIEDIQIIKESNEVLVYINAYHKKEHDLHVIRFANDGSEKSTFNLTKNHEMKLSSVSASYLNKGTYIYTGTYSPKSSYSSVGVYLCKTKNDEVIFFKFYKFLEFDNFLSYLPEKKKAKIEKKKKKKAKKGKEMNLNYLMASHDIQFIDGKYIYIGEAHYPTYRTETYTTTVNGKTVTRTRQVFDGYQYTHATVAGFNEQGDKLWDNTFEMWPSYKPYFHKKFITSSILDNRKINLLFSSNSNITAKTFFANGKITDEATYSYIETADDNDKIKRTFSNLEHWYGKYFIAHGSQKIKNKENKFGAKKRKVYFMNKVSYR
jgi:hypothetical protein